MSFKNVSLIHQVVRPTCLSTFSRSDERLKRRQTISTANTEAPYGEVNGSVGRRSKRNIQPLSWSATFFSLFLPLVFFCLLTINMDSNYSRIFFVAFFFFFYSKGNMLCSRDNMPATQRVNTMQPIPCDRFQPI